MEEIITDKQKISKNMGNCLKNIITPIIQETSYQKQNLAQSK